MIEHAFRVVAPELIEPGDIVLADAARITVETILKTANGITIKGPLTERASSATKSYTFERGYTALVNADPETLDEIETVLLRGQRTGAGADTWLVNAGGELVVRLRPPAETPNDGPRDGPPVEWTVPLRAAVAEAVVADAKRGVPKPPEDDK